MNNKNTQDVEFWVETTLNSNDDRTAKLEIRHSVSRHSFDTFIKTIYQARKKKVNLAPLANFLNNDELKFFIDNEWKLTDIEFIIHRSQIIKLLKEAKENGLSMSQVKNKWPHVSHCFVSKSLLSLHLDGYIVPTRYAGENGGYVLKELYEKNQEIGLEKKSITSSSNYEDYNSNDIKQQTQPKKKPKHITKSEGRILRKSIINKADKNSVCITGFKKEFIDNLTDREKEYLDSISDLAIKIMRSEVIK